MVTSIEYYGLSKVSSANTVLNGWWMEFKYKTIVIANVNYPSPYDTLSINPVANNLNQVLIDFYP